MKSHEPHVKNNLVLISVAFTSLQVWGMHKLVWSDNAVLFLQLCDLMCAEDLGCAIYIFDLLGGRRYILERFYEGRSLLHRQTCYKTYIQTKN